MKKTVVLSILLILAIFGTWLISTESGNTEVAESKVKRAKTCFYDVAFTSSGWVDSGKLLSSFTGNGAVSAKENFISGLKYQLVLKPLGRKQFVASLTNISTTTDVDLGRLYSPVLVAQSSDGNLSIDTEQFDYDPQLLDVISVSIEKLQFNVAPYGVTEWTAKEHGQFGRYLAGYNLLSQSQDERLFQKTKQEYDLNDDQQGLFNSQGASIQIKSSNTQLSVSKTDERIVSVSSDETLSMHNNQGQTAEFHHAITLHLGAGNPPSTQWSTLRDVSQYYSANPSQPESEEQIATSFTDFSDQLSWFEANVLNDEVFAIDQMILWLKKYPEEAGSLAHHLSENIYNINQNVELRLWFALVEAGSAPIQQAFAEIISTSASDSLSLFRVLSYSHDFSEPTAQLIDSLWRASEQLSTGDQDEQELSSMAIYVLGSLMNDSKADSVEKQNLVQEFQSKLSSPSDLSAALLLGVGNSQREELLPNIAPYFSSPDAQISAAAFEALSHFPADSVNDAFIMEYQEIESEAVKEQALYALGQFEQNKTLNNWVAQQLDEPVSSDEFRVFVDYLGKSADSDSDSEATIRNLLTQELSVEQKRLIYQYVTPKPER